jgi:hypothetical protein
MHVADHEDGSYCSVQDPDQECEEEAGVTDLRSLTGWTTAGAATGECDEYTDGIGLAGAWMHVFHVKLSGPANAAITLR